MMSDGNPVVEQMVLSEPRAEKRKHDTFTQEEIQQVVDAPNDEARWKIAAKLGMPHATWIFLSENSETKKAPKQAEGTESQGSQTSNSQKLDKNIQSKSVVANVDENNHESSNRETTVSRGIASVPNNDLSVANEDHDPVEPEATSSKKRHKTYTKEDYQRIINAPTTSDRRRIAKEIGMPYKTAWSIMDRYKKTGIDHDGRHDNTFIRKHFYYLESSDDESHVGPRNNGHHKSYTEEEYRKIIRAPTTWDRWRIADEIGMPYKTAWSIMDRYKKEGKDHDERRGKITARAVDDSSDSESSEDESLQKLYREIEEHRKEQLKQSSTPST